MSRLALALALLAGALFASPVLSTARAQGSGETHLAAAREFIEVKGAMAAFDSAVPGLVEQIAQNFLRTNPDLGRQLAEVSELLRTEFAPRRSQILDILARSYITRFSEAELREIIAFYKTPVGRKFVQQEPLVVEDSFGRLQEWSNTLSQEMVRRMREEMRKRGFNI
jgi:hypothetical protein